MLIRTPSDLGAAIRDRRRHLKLDQATLAKRIGVSRQWVIAIERGRSRAELGLVLHALDALGIGLNAEVTEPSRSAGKTKVDIDDIVASARQYKR
ncbi:MAG: helix-turn-helix domain-containing protein [Xanthobacteraceae bacterium]|nr:helix-turn-helix domain-containing protein [Xanthobacteraceae bacterium]